MRASLVVATLGLAIWLVGCGDDQGSSRDDDSIVDVARETEEQPDTEAPLEAEVQPEVEADAAEDTVSPWSPPVVVYPPDDEEADFYISDTGLYRDLATKTLAPDLIAFEPAYKLWSDGVDKRRWVRLPGGTTIDTSDLDHWELPIGATLFKEFSTGGKLLETRVIARLGPGRWDYWMGAFIWDDEEADARFAPMGATDVRDTAHNVPTTTQCWTCHNGDPGHALGLSAIQLDAAGQLDPLIEDGLLSHPPADDDRPLVPPGDEVTAAALGYLHANCGHCHNDFGSARPDADMDLRLRVGERTVEDTAIYRTTVGVELQNFMDDAFTYRVVPGEPDASAVLYRMTFRGKGQMPPLGTEEPHRDGIAFIEAWIEALSGL